MRTSLADGPPTRIAESDFPPHLVTATAARTRLGDEPKSLGGEVGIETEYVGYAFSLHDHEARRVHEAHVPPVHSEQALERAAVHLLIDPMDREYREQSRLEVAHRCQPDPMLEQRGGFNQDVVGRVETDPAVERSLERRYDRRVFAFSPDEDGIERGRIDEETHRR